MRLKIEEAFYSKRGRHLGEPSVRLASKIEVLLELHVTGETYLRAAPLVDRLRRGTISRRRYEQLVAVFTANAMTTGQVDETDAILDVLAMMWDRCPARYLPDLRPLRLKILSWLDRRVEASERGHDDPHADA